MYLSLLNLPITTDTSMAVKDGAFDLSVNSFRSYPKYSKFCFSLPFLFPLYCSIIKWGYDDSAEYVSKPLL